ncbi:MAG: pyrroline-5-carboxylate reductase [Chitinophagales bacterium]|nr:pyrroline-5-carboxylate reductase [Chitinophagales bacterium]MCZ2392675.1 pyrroline-5-carboxylate reductase [Chitinophagales bacterium]
MNILIIGGGNMGKSLAQSIIQAKIVPNKQLFIFEKDEDRIKELDKQNIGTVFSNPNEHFKEADIFILAVKPQDSASIYPLITPNIHPDKIVLSIMAGIKIESIKNGTNAHKIVRTMPNLPCMVNKGVTGFITNGLNDDDKTFILKILQSIGIAVEVDEESKIDAITALSGSGPAYVYYFIDAITQAAIQLGLNKTEAAQLVVQTFEGSIELYKNNNLSCSEWIQKVSSKGGTTEAALEVFDQSNLKNLIGKGVLRAEQRSKELSKG